MITPPAPIITPEEIKRIPGLIALFMKAWDRANGKTVDDDVAIALATVLSEWPNANKAYFAQGPHIMLPVTK